MNKNVLETNNKYKDLYFDINPTPNLYRKVVTDKDNKTFEKCNKVEIKSVKEFMNKQEKNNE